VGVPHRHHDPGEPVLDAQRCIVAPSSDGISTRPTTRTHGAGDNALTTAWQGWLRAHVCFECGSAIVVERKPDGGSRAPAVENVDGPGLSRCAALERLEPAGPTELLVRAATDDLLRRRASSDEEQEGQRATHHVASMSDRDFGHLR
jgi:hypothetical protein